MIMVPSVGRIAALFDRSFYIETGHDYFCFGMPGLGPGPLNGLITVPQRPYWRDLGVTVDQQVDITPALIVVDKTLAFDLTAADRWMPPPVPDQWSLEGLDRRLRALRSLAAQKAPPEGFAPLLGRGPANGRETPLLRFAAGPITHFEDWLTGHFTPAGGGEDRPLAQACTLIGAGPGLTPSGDDFLGGAMIALHRLGDLDTLESLGAAILENLDRTTPIAASHLRAAMSGTGTGIVHDMLDSLMAGNVDALSEKLAAVDRIGHTSGWDMLTGACSVFEIYLKTRPRLARTNA